MQGKCEKAIGKIRTKIVEAANPDVIDINYGCPVKKVVCKGAGSGILQDIPRMVALTKAVVDATNKPVTVKTRLGWDDDTQFVVDVAEQLQDVGIQGISIHGRTRKQMYKGEANWDLIRETKQNPRLTIPVFGNGDIDSGAKAKKYRDEYGVDGIMIGRAAIGYPWIFNEVKHYFKTGEVLAEPTIAERVEAAKFHLFESVRWKGDILGIIEMRRHYTNYFRGLPDIKSYRMQLVTCPTETEVIQILDEILKAYT